MLRWTFKYNNLITFQILDHGCVHFIPMRLISPWMCYEERMKIKWKEKEEEEFEIQLHFCWHQNVIDFDWRSSKSIVFILYSQMQWQLCVLPKEIQWTSVGE